MKTFFGSLRRIKKIFWLSLMEYLIYLGFKNRCLPSMDATLINSDRWNYLVVLLLVFHSGLFVIVFLRNLYLHQKCLHLQANCNPNWEFSRKCYQFRGSQTVPCPRAFKKQRLQAAISQMKKVKVHQRAFLELYKTIWFFSVLKSSC